MGAHDSKEIQEKYHIQKIKLGEGTFGTVWRAVDRATQEVFAVKAMDMAKMRQKGLNEKDLLREISMLRASEGCENITQLADTFQDGTYYYLALEYCDGGDFGDKVKEKSDHLEEWEAAKWMRQILNAIDFLHRKNVIHRDIKPDNFLFGGTSGNTLKLSDFGLAMQLDRPGALLTEKCGTPAFMAPEQHQLPRSKGYGLGVDVWAAGVCMWCLLHGGSHPFMDGAALILPELLQGQPAFRKGAGFWARSKWSDAAQALSKVMTHPNNQERPSVQSVLRDGWFHKFVEPERGSQPLKPERGSQENENLQRVNENLQQALEKAAKEKTDGERKLRELQEQIREQERSRDSEPKAGFFDGFADGVKDIHAGLKDILGVRNALFSGTAGSERKPRLCDDGRIMRAGSAIEPPCQEPPEVAAKLSAPAFQDRRPDEERDRDRVRGAERYSERPIAISSERARPERISVSAEPRRSMETLGLLPVGSVVRYNSVSLNQYVDAVVQGYNEIDQTYNLDLKQRASTDRIAPPSEKFARWPNGSSIIYESASLASWIDGVIVGFNDNDGSYDLGTPDGGPLKEHALATKIRPRVVSSARSPDVNANFQILAPDGSRPDIGWNFDVPKGPPAGKLENPFSGNVPIPSDIPRDFTAFSTTSNGHATARRSTLVRDTPILTPIERGITRDFTQPSNGSCVQSAWRGYSPAAASNHTPRSNSSTAEDAMHVSLTCGKCTRTYWSASGKSKTCPMCRAVAVDSEECRIPAGTACSYIQPGQQIWQPGIVDGFFEGGVYVRAASGHIALSWPEVAPPASHPPWPRGAWVIYESASHNAWLPAVVVTINEDGTYNLNNKQRAPRERIRIRLTSDFCPIDLQGNPLHPVSPGLP